MSPLLVIVHRSLRRSLFLGLVFSGLVAATTQRELHRGHDGDPAALVGWTTITRTSEFTVAVRLDASRQRGHRHRVRMWGRFDYARGQTDARNRVFMSTVHQIEYDCLRPRSRLLRATNYTGAMGDGRLVDQARGVSPWTDNIPETIGELMWQTACLGSLSDAVPSM